MSDKKISQLTAATTPLAGTETLPIVQGGQTVKVSAQSIANLAPAELPSQSGNANKYLQTNGTTASWDAVNISTADITGTLPIANGGTGQTSAANAINALLPSQASQSGKYLTTNGSVASWETVSAGAIFTFASWNWSFGGGGIFATNLLANTTGNTITIAQVSNYLVLTTTVPTFTTNKTFVACSNIRTNTPSIGIFGGVEFTSTQELRIMFYDTAGAPFVFGGASQPRIGVLNVQIYP